MMKLRYFPLIMSLTLASACATNGGTNSSKDIPRDAKAAEINMQLGLSYLQRGDYKIALAKLEKALAQNPDLPSAHNTIALLYQRLGELDKAEAHFKQAIQRAPDYSEAQNNYGVFLCQQKRYAEAEQRFTTAVKNPLYNSQAQALENAGLCAMREPDTAKAESYFREALKLNPDLAKSLINMAELSYQQNNYLRARGYVQRYQAVSAWNPSALLIAIKTENQLNDQDAVASLELILRARFPDSDEAHQVAKGQY